MKYSFDDVWFGLTKDGNKLDERIVQRPAGLTQETWYSFAGALAKKMNEKMGLDQ